MLEALLLTKQHVNALFVPSSSHANSHNSGVAAVPPIDRCRAEHAEPLAAFQGVLAAWKAVDPRGGGTHGSCSLLHEVHANFRALTLFFQRCGHHVQHLLATAEYLEEASRALAARRAELSSSSTTACPNRHKMLEELAKDRKRHADAKRAFADGDLTKFVVVQSRAVHSATAVVVEMLRKALAASKQQDTDSNNENDCDIVRRKLVPFLCCARRVDGDGDSKCCVLKPLFASILRLAIACNHSHSASAISATMLRRVHEQDAQCSASAAKITQILSQEPRAASATTASVHLPSKSIATAGVFLSRLDAVGFSCRALLEGLHKFFAPSVSFFFSVCPSEQQDDDDRDGCGAHAVVDAIEQIVSDAVSCFCAADAQGEDTSIKDSGCNANLHLVIHFLDTMCRDDDDDTGSLGAHLGNHARQAIPVVAREGNPARTAALAQFAVRADAALRRSWSAAHNNNTNDHNTAAAAADVDDDDDSDGAGLCFKWNSAGKLESDEQPTYSKRDVARMLEEQRGRAKAEEAVLRAVMHDYLRRNEALKAQALEALQRERELAKENARLKQQ